MILRHECWILAMLSLHISVSCFTRVLSHLVLKSACNMFWLSLKTQFDRTLCVKHTTCLRLVSRLCRMIPALMIVSASQNMPAQVTNDDRKVISSWNVSKPSTHEFHACAHDASETKNRHKLVLIPARWISSSIAFKRSISSFIALSSGVSADLRFPPAFFFGMIDLNLLLDCVKYWLNP